MSHLWHNSIRSNTFPIILLTYAILFVKLEIYWSIDRPIIYEIGRLPHTGPVLLPDRQDEQVSVLLSRFSPQFYGVASLTGFHATGRTLLERITGVFSVVYNRLSMLIFYSPQNLSNPTLVWVRNDEMLICVQRLCRREIIPDYTGVGSSVCE